MTPTNGGELSSGELAHHVLEYLSSEGFSRTFQQFEQEAGGVLRSSRRHSRGGAAKSLREMLREYSVLIEAEQRKQRLMESNPLARQMYSILETESQQQSHRNPAASLEATEARDRPSTGMLASYSGGLSHQNTPDMPRINRGGSGPMQTYGQRQAQTNNHHQTSRNLFGGDAMAALAVSPRGRRRKGTPKKKKKQKRNAGTSLLNVNGNERKNELHLFAEDLAGQVNNKGDLLDLEKFIEETAWDNFLPEFVQAMNAEQPVADQPQPQPKKASLADALRDEDEDPEALLDNVKY